MKKLLILFFSLLLISINLFIFGYGMAAKYGAGRYYNALRVKWLLNSALTLAVHNYEDTGRRPEITGEDALGKDRLYHTISEIDNDNIYIKLRVKHEGKEFTKDYVCKK